MKKTKWKERIFSLLTASVLILGMTSCVGMLPQPSKNEETAATTAETVTEAHTEKEETTTVKKNKSKKPKLKNSSEDESEDTSEATETTKVQKKAETVPVTPEYESITAWTMDDFLEDFSLCGVKYFSSAVTPEVKFEKFGMSQTMYISELDMTVCDIISNSDKEHVAMLYSAGKSDTVEEFIYSPPVFISFDTEFMPKLPEFSVMGITNNSTRADVVKALGEPNAEDNRYFFSYGKFIQFSFDPANGGKLASLLIKLNVEPTAAAEQYTQEENTQPLSWTIDDMLSDITLCGEKLNLSGTPKEVSDKFEYVNCDYMEERGCTAIDLQKNGNVVASVFAGGNEKEYEKNKVILFGMDRSITGSLPEFSIMGITGKSTRDDVIRILGNPSYESDDGTDDVVRYIFTDDVHVMFVFDPTDNYKIRIISIFFDYNGELIY